MCICCSNRGTTVVVQGTNQEHLHQLSLWASDRNFPTRLTEFNDLNQVMKSFQNFWSYFCHNVTEHLCIVICSLLQLDDEWCAVLAMIGPRDRVDAVIGTLPPLWVVQPTASQLMSNQVKPRFDLEDCFAVMQPAESSRLLETDKVLTCNQENIHICATWNWVTSKVMCENEHSFLPLGLAKVANI